MWSSCIILMAVILAARQDVRFFKTFRCHAVLPGGPVRATWRIHPEGFKALWSSWQNPLAYEPCSSPRSQFLHDSVRLYSRGGRVGATWTIHKNKRSKTMWISCIILKAMILAARQHVRFFQTFRFHAGLPGGPVGATWRIHPDAFKNLVELLQIPEGYEP